MFMTTRLRKGCNSTTMYFRDMGPFENPLFTHVNIGFNISDPPGTKLRPPQAGDELEMVILSRAYHIPYFK